MVEVDEENLDCKSSVSTPAREKMLQFVMLQKKKERKVYITEAFAKDLENSVDNNESLVVMAFV